MARKDKTKVRTRRPKKDKTRPTGEGTEYKPDHQQEAGYWNWLNSRHKAAAILNADRRRPYWASIEYDGSIPVSNYYPCTMFRKSDRLYYGFLIRDHRESFINDCYKLNARREYTGADGCTPL